MAFCSSLSTLRLKRSEYTVATYKDCSTELTETNVVLRVCVRSGARVLQKVKEAVGKQQPVLHLH